MIARITFCLFAMVLLAAPAFAGDVSYRLSTPGVK